MKLNCVLKIRYLLSTLSFAFFFIIHFCTLIVLLFSTFDFFRCVPYAHVTTALWSLSTLVEDGWGGIQINTARDRIPTVNFQFLKLVQVLHISLLQKVDCVQVFVYISYHPYVFICILRFLGFICMSLVCIRILPLCIRMNGIILFFATLCISTYNVSLFIEWFTTIFIIFTMFIYLIIYDPITKLH